MTNPSDGPNSSGSDNGQVDLSIGNKFPSITVKPLWRRLSTILLSVSLSIAFIQWGFNIFPEMISGNVTTNYLINGAVFTSFIYLIADMFRIDIEVDKKVKDQIHHDNTMKRLFGDSPKDA